MDRLLFVPLVADSRWVLDILPSTSPAELPVAGRRFVDYGLEFAKKVGGTTLAVLDWNWSKRLAEYFSSPERSGSALRYKRGTGPLPRGLDDILGIAEQITQSTADGLVVVWGLCMPLAMTHVDTEPVTPEDCAATPAGIYRRDKGTWTRLKPAMFTVENAKGWHELNFTILHTPPGTFTLPGYTTERDVHIGRNVVIEHGTEVKPPVILQDNTWFARNVRLDGDVIVESGSYVSEGARLRRTIVGPNTFIGAGLDLEGKIVVGRRVIDPDTGTWVDLEEPGLARSIPTGLGWIRKLWRFMRGRSFGRRG